MYGRKPRTKSTEQLLGELTKLYRLGWKGSVFIVDDNFISHKKKVKIVLKALIQWQQEHSYPFNFIIQASINIADDRELLKLMRDAFFTYVFIGFETPNIESLKECGKYQNILRNYREVVETLHKHGMQVMGAFIVGFDNDKKDIFQKQIDIIQNTGLTQAMISILSAIPNTKLWHRLKKEGRLLGAPTGENTDGTTNFRTRIDLSILKQGYSHILKSIYSPANFYKRMNAFMEIYSPHQQNNTSFKIIKALIKTLWYIGVISQSRKYFWKLVLKTIFKKVKALPEILHMTVAGEHFITFTKSVVAKLSIQEKAIDCGE